MQGRGKQTNELFLAKPQSQTNLEGCLHSGKPYGEASQLRTWLQPEGRNFEGTGLKRHKSQEVTLSAAEATEEKQSPLTTGEDGPYHPRGAGVGKRAVETDILALKEPGRTRDFPAEKP